MAAEGEMGIANPAESIVGILALIDEVRAKMAGTALGDYAWRPVSEDSADALASLVSDPMERCQDTTETLIVVTVAAVLVAARERKRPM
jgi:hypothetical protein